MDTLTREQRHRRFRKQFNAESEYTNTISARYYKDGSEILIDLGKGKNPESLRPENVPDCRGFQNNLPKK